MARTVEDIAHAAAGQANEGLLRELALPLMLSSLGALIVIATGWISDDGFITMRYADNVLHGHGPVFNVGERVQGYTHPLWFLLVTAGLALYKEPVVVAAVLGGVLTFLTLLVVFSAFQQTCDSIQASVLSGLLFCLLLTSDAWLSFQTAGLENALSHFILALLLIEIWLNPAPRPLQVSLLSSGLLLTRPDFALLLAPFGLYVLLSARNLRTVANLLLGSLPLLVWSAFATLYYGEFFPNTANAKLGIYSLDTGIARGLTYIWDFCSHEPVTALSALVLFSLGVCSAPNMASRWFSLGLVLYVAYIIYLGGDFMRGRLLMPIFFCSALTGTFALATMRQSLSSAKTFIVAGSSLMVLVVILQFLTVKIDRTISTHGIANERAYYRDMHLDQYLANGTLQYPSFEHAQIKDLKGFADRCGPFSVHAGSVGAFGYLVGPRVAVIDVLGLTDRFIAGLPRSNLVKDSPRPGHARKYIPVSYLAGRGDIALFADWKQAVTERDCGIIAATSRYLASTEMVNPYQVTDSWPRYLDNR